MKKMVVLLCSLTLTLCAFTSSHAMSSSNESGANPFVDGVDSAIAKQPADALKSNLDFNSDNTFVRSDSPNLDAVIDNSRSTAPSIPRIQPDPKSHSKDSETNAGRTSGNFTLVKVALAEPIRHESGSTGLSKISRLDTTAMPRDFLSMQATSTASRPRTPEPAVLILLGTGLIGLAGYGKRKFKR